VTTLEAGAPLTNVIVTFTVEPSEQQRLVQSGKATMSPQVFEVVLTQ